MKLAPPESDVGWNVILMVAVGLRTMMTPPGTDSDML